MNAANELAGLTSPHVIGYVRVSSIDQVDGYSLSEQEDRIKRFAEANHLIVVQIFSDKGRSGRSILGRPGLIEALRLVLRGGIGAVIVHRDDRLSRRTTNSGLIETFLFQHRTALVALEPFLVSTGSDHAANNIRGIIQMLAQDEADKISQRVSPALVTAAQRGIRGGHVPPGYVRLDKGHWDVDPQCGSVIADLFRHVANNQWSAYRCTRFLRESGIRRKDGKALSLEQVDYLLRNSWYTGTMSWKLPQRSRSVPDEEIVRDNHHPALVDVELFARVQQELARQTQARRDQRPAKTNAAPASPVSPATVGTSGRQVASLSQKLTNRQPIEDLLRARMKTGGHGVVPPSVAVCRCGSAVYCTMVKMGPPGHRYKVPKYQCEHSRRFGKAACPQLPVRGDEVDAAVEKALFQAVSSRRLAHAVAPSVPPDLTAIDQQITELSEKCTRVKAGAAQATGADQIRLMARVQVLEAERAQLESQRQRESTAGSRPLGSLGAFLANPKTVWSTATVQERRQLVSSLIHEVVIADKMVTSITWQSDVERDEVAPPSRSHSSRESVTLVAP